MSYIPSKATDLYSKKIPDRGWSEAVVFGALWGAMEITLGTFLHMLRVPFAGIFLSAAAAGLLFAGTALSNDKWLPLKASLISASCRALIPAGVLIFTPMIAILMEGFFISLAIHLLGKGLLGALMSGVLATSWSLMQKFLTQLLFYGATLIDLYTGLLNKGAFWLGLDPELLGLGIVLFLVSLTWLFGLAGGLFGYLIAKKFPELDPSVVTSLGSSVDSQMTDLDQCDSANDQFKSCAVSSEVEIEQKSVWPALIAAIFSLVMLAFGQIGYALLGLVTVTGFSAMSEPRVFMRIGRLRFWLITLVIALLSGMAIGTKTGSLYGVPYSLDGIMAGGMMITRAAVLILAVGLISVRLNRQKMLVFFNRFGAGNFGAVLSMTAELTPIMVTGWRRALDLCDSDGKKMSLVLRTAVMLKGASLLVRRFEQSQSPVLIDSEKIQLWVVTGPVGSGKTSALIRIASEAIRAKHSIRGFLQVRTTSGKRSDYDLVILNNGVILGDSRARVDDWDFGNCERLPFLRRPSLGKPHFSEIAFKRSEEELLLLREEKVSLLLIDELGWVEANGEGHMIPLLRLLASCRVGRVIAAVREDRLQQVLDRLAEVAVVSQVIVLPSKKNLDSFINFSVELD